MVQSSPTPQKRKTPQKAYTPKNCPNPSPMSGKRCFKCQGLGNIASDCPNRKVISLAKWETIKEDDEDEGKEESVEKEEESPEEEVSGADEARCLFTTSIKHSKK